MCSEWQSRQQFEGLKCADKRCYLDEDLGCAFDEGLEMRAVMVQRRVTNFVCGGGQFLERGI